MRKYFVTVRASHIGYHAAGHIDSVIEVEGWAEVTSYGALVIYDRQWGSDKEERRIVAAFSPNGWRDVHTA
jgi:hypothetical protein